MTDSKTPEWIEAASGDLALDYVDWLGRDKVDPDAEHVLAASASQALLSAYERGRADSRVDFISWLRGWVKKRFGIWITYNTARGAFDGYQEAKENDNER